MRFPHIILLISAFLFSACGGGLAEDDSTIDVAPAAESAVVSGKTLAEVLDGVPYVTDPVLKDVEAEQRVADSYVGIASGAMDGDYWNDRLSLGLCHQAQMFHETLNAARDVDMLTCVAREFLGDVVLTGSAQRFVTSMPADEHDHQDSTFLLEVEHSEDALGNTQLVVTACEDGVQQQRVEHVLSGDYLEEGTMSVLATRIEEHGESRSLHNLSASAALAAGKEDYQSNMVHLLYAHAGYGNDRHGEVFTAPHNGFVSTSGIEQGVYHGTQEYRRTNAGVAELLHDDDVERIALGHGYALGEELGEEFDDEAYHDQWNEGWNGDTMRAVALHEATIGGIADPLPVPEVTDPPAIAFDANDVISCDAGTATAIEMDAAAVYAACGQFMTEPQRSFNCHDVVRNGSAAYSEPR